MEKKYIVIFDIILALVCLYLISFTYLEINSNFQTNSNPEIILHITNKFNDIVNVADQNTVVTSIDQNNFSINTDLNLTSVVNATPSETNTSSGYTLVDVSIHNTSNDCWMVVLDKVYDVTTYIRSHPGGSTILNGCGKDATQMFEQIHSKRAYDVLVPYYIGNLIP